MSTLPWGHRCRPGIAALFVFVASASMLAQSAPPATATAPPAARADPALPTARSIIDRHIAAIGGRAAILARTSTHASGTMSIPSQGMSGSLEVFAAKPNKTLLRITLGGIGAIEEGFDGTIGWSLSPMTGPTLVVDKELEQKRFDSDFLADLHADGRYESMATIEKTEFDGRPCYKLRLLRRGGLEEFEFYDVATGLKAGGIASRESPMGVITATTIEMDYKQFGPLKQATTIKATTVGLQQVLTLTLFEYDKVAPSTFEVPAVIKALVK